MYYDVGGLMPYSLHAFRVVACTIKGCGSSSLVKARTMEAKPDGFVTMEAEVTDARSIQVKWTPPIDPNGDLQYDVYFEGTFYRNPGKYRNVPLIRPVYIKTSLYQEWSIIKTSPLLRPVNY